MEAQTSGFVNKFGSSADGENSASQAQVIEKNITDKIKKEVGKIVMAIKNRVNDAILTALDNVVIPPVEMAARSITQSSGRGPSSVIQNPDRKDLTGNTVNTPLISASSRVDLTVDQYRNDETRNV